MTEPAIKELLSYHQPVNDRAFNQQVIAKIKAADRKRRMIMMLFTLFGLIASTAYLWLALTDVTPQNLLTPVNSLLLFSVGLFIVWLWTEDLASN